jgi:hypothetical protein
MKLPKVTVEEYGRCAQAEGEKVTKVGDTWWREVRPFFYRPLVPHLELSPTDIGRPAQARLGGFQYVVPPGTPSNSQIDFLMFTDAQAYSLEKLNPRRRTEVRSAAKRFTVRPFESCEEFKQNAHPVYISFFQRTGYRYLSSRRDKKEFDRWAERIFNAPGTIVLGAFAGTELLAVNSSRIIGDTLAYSTFFSREDALRHPVSSLMLHSVRSAAAASGDIRQVFAGMRKWDERRSIDDFYVRRGCTILSKPAWLELNPLVSWAMRSFRPDLLRQLTGQATG